MKKKPFELSHQMARGGIRSFYTGRILNKGSRAENVCIKWRPDWQLEGDSILNTGASLLFEDQDILIWKQSKRRAEHAV